MPLKPYSEASPGQEWIKSSYSTDEGPDCVEMATTLNGLLVRDSKRPQGPRLAVAPTAWVAFLPYASDR
ncbi:DUF397 domain-containing protein [Streptomyces sp. WAC 01325]|uniref:DUF397 domain-containing protein n=1 Tax=Streptomyces sp. WAC 01325 TaxID=2203202 RepID=UPI000F887A6E|nr:DUF397 domain-containing protein [Streptomyces sp. WAC 01325]RSN07917.1 DUF397 domain-containing protein [Streptomyces sp. WAC 01325]